MAGRVGFALERTYLKRAFQLSVELKVRDNAYGTVKYNGIFIYNWAKNKFTDLPFPEKICSFSNTRGGQEVEIIYDLDRPYFCMKASHPDAQVAGRVWTTEAEIIEHEEKVLLGVKLSYTTPVSLNAEDVYFSVPNFVRQIYEKNGIIDVWELQPRAHVLAPGEIDRLYELIESPERKLPVIVITERASTDQIGSQYQSGFLLDGDRLARKIGLIAHIVCLDIDSTQAWNEKVGKEWGVYNGAVRTYYPGLCFDSENYYRHPLSTPNRILAAYYEEDGGAEHIGGDAFAYVLVEKIESYNTRLRLSWDTLGHKFYYAARRQIALEGQKDIKDAEEMEKLYNEDIEEKEQEMASYLDEIEEMQDQLKEKEQEIYKLNSQINTLNHTLNKVYSEGKIEVPILDNYDALPAWIEEYFSGRLFLHSRAKNALKNALFEDVPLVYKALKMLGTTYWEMKSGYDTGKDKFEEECAALGLKDSGAISDTAAGERGDTYFVQHQGKRCKIDRHLKKGEIREPLRCLRIYYFWNDEDSTIVIASLPQHLEIKSS